MTMSETVAFINNNAGFIGLIFSFVVTLSTVVYAYLTWQLTSETRRMRKVQSDPVVSIFADMNSMSFGAIDIVCKNEGSGAARDVNFEVSFESGKETPVAQDIHNTFSRLGFLKHGIPQLYSGQEVRSFFTTSFGNLDDLVNVDIHFIVRYRSIRGDSFLSKYNVTFKHFYNLSVVGNSQLDDIKKEIAGINKSLSEICSNSFYLNVVSTTDQEIKQKMINMRKRLYPSSEGGE